VVFLSAIPITILMNSLRIGLVGVLVNHWGTQAAEGLLHFFEGWTIFIASAGLLIGEIVLFARFASGKPFFEIFALPVVTAPHVSSPSAQSKAFITVSLVLLCLGGTATYLLSNRQEIVPERQRFVGFPNGLGMWQGRPSLLEPQVEHALGLEDYILADYSSPGSGAVNLYIAYYASQRKGVSPHSPIVCMPGGGWQISRFERTAYTAGNLSLPFNRAIIERNSTKQLVYYWFVQRGRTISNEYVSKWYLLADAILENRTDGALVRLTTPLYPGEVEQSADRRLQSFIQELQPRLAGYLPGRLASAH
jgi:exosortase D (VPLPA-CTERM-specific)